MARAALAAAEAPAMPTAPGADAAPALADALHKAISPATYPCSLCAVTYGAVSMRGAWRSFLESLPNARRFYHRDDFAADFPGFEVALPAILTHRQGETPMVGTALSRRHIADAAHPDQAGRVLVGAPFQNLRRVLGRHEEIGADRLRQPGQDGRTQRRDHAVGVAVAWVWLGASLFNVARYMADARAQVLPLVGGGEHDWTEILSRWGLLASDVRLAGLLRVVATLVTVGACVWL